VLGADYLVEGSIRREGNRLRIVAQLIESQEETHLWAATFDRVVGGEPLSANSFQESAFGERLSAFSDRQSAVGGQLSAVGDQRSAVATDGLTVQAEVAQQIVRGVLEAIRQKG
jgi:hypothetical protein